MSRRIVLLLLYHQTGKLGIAHQRSLLTVNPLNSLLIIFKCLSLEFHKWSTHGQTRTADILCVRQTLLPTELHGHVLKYLSSQQIYYIIVLITRKEKNYKALIFLCADFQSAYFRFAVCAFRIGLIGLEPMTPRLSSVCSNH